MTLREHALRTLARSWMIAIRETDRELFDHLCLRFLFGPQEFVPDFPIAGLADEVAVQTRAILQELGEQVLPSGDPPEN